MEEEKSDLEIEIECWQNIVDRLDDERANNRKINTQRYKSSVRQLHYLRSLLKNG